MARLQLSVLALLCAGLAGCTYAELGASMRASDEADKAAAKAMVSTEASAYCVALAPGWRGFTKVQHLALPRKFATDNKVRMPATPTPSLMDRQSFARLVASSRAPVSDCLVMGNAPARYEETDVLRSYPHIQIGVNRAATRIVKGSASYKDWMLTEGPGMSVPGSVNTFESFQNSTEAKRKVPTRMSEYIVLGLLTDDDDGDGSLASVRALVGAFQRAYCAVAAGDFDTARNYIGALDTVYRTTRLNLSPLAEWIGDAAEKLHKSSMPQDIFDRLLSWENIQGRVRLNWMDGGAVPDNNGFCVAFYPDRNFPSKTYSSLHPEPNDLGASPEPGFRWWNPPRR